MDDIRETYDLPRKTPPTFRYIAFLLAFVVAAPLAWLVLPDGIVTVAVLAILFLLIVFMGVRAVLASRELNEPPPRRPVPTRPD